MRSATPHSQKLKLQIALDARYQDIFLLSALHNVSESGYPYYEFLNVRNTATATTTAVQTPLFTRGSQSADSLLKR